MNGVLNVLCTGGVGMGLRFRLHPVGADGFHVFRLGLLWSSPVVLLSSRPTLRRPELLVVVGPAAISAGSVSTVLSSAFYFSILSYRSPLSLSLSLSLSLLFLIRPSLSSHHSPLSLSFLSLAPLSLLFLILHPSLLSFAPLQVHCS